MFPLSSGKTQGKIQGLTGGGAYFQCYKETKTLNFYVGLFEAVKLQTWWLMYCFDILTLHVARRQFFPPIR